MPTAPPVRIHNLIDGDLFPSGNCERTQGSALFAALTKKGLSPHGEAPVCLPNRLPTDARQESWVKAKMRQYGVLNGA
jgi:hypothetical protein